MPGIQQTQWPDDFVRFDNGNLLVHPRLAASFRDRNWLTCHDVLTDASVSLTNERGIRDIATVSLEEGQSGEAVSVYLKRHRHPRRLQEAGAEATAAEQCRKAGVPCMEIAAVGYHDESESIDGGWHSFFMSFKVGDGKSAYDLAAEILEEASEAQQEKLFAVMDQVARVLAGLHNVGLFHRDCYLQHFIVDADTDETGLLQRNNPEPVVRLIDLQATRRQSGIAAVYARIKDLEHIAHSIESLKLTRRERRYWYDAYFSQLSTRLSLIGVTRLVHGAICFRKLLRAHKSRVRRLKQHCWSALHRLNRQRCPSASNR